MAEDSGVDICVPGDRLGHVSEFGAGAGTFCRGAHIYSSVTGTKVLGEQDGKNVVSVVQMSERKRLPEIGNVVTAKVTKINARYASVEILCIGKHSLKETFPGIIRAHDVRAVKVDNVEIPKCFRPGDIVRAEVISLGETNNKAYFLSTAKNELGVVFAESVAGATMIPISWQEMQCPKTKMREQRKVAKVA